MSSKHAKFRIVPVMFAAAVAMSACSSDPMMADGMDKGMDGQMMDDMKGMDTMDNGRNDSMDDSMESKM